MEIRSDIKSGRFSTTTPPPAPEADKLGLAVVCTLADIPYETAVSRLAAVGIRPAGPGTTLAALAEASGSTPERIYAILASK
jgi:hypothetical protein